MQQHPKVWDWRTWILKHGPKNASYRHILLTLSCYMDSAGQSCFPSYDTLEAATQLSRPTLSKYLKQAKKDGWLEVTQHGYKGKKWARNEYRASIPEKVVKAVNSLNHQGSKGSKPAYEGSKADTDKAVNEVNSTSPEYTSTDNSTERERAREEKAEPEKNGNAFNPVGHIEDQWDVSVRSLQAEEIRVTVTDEDRWRAIVKRFRRQGDTQQRKIAWALNDYENPKQQKRNGSHSNGSAFDPGAEDKYAHLFDGG